MEIGIRFFILKMGTLELFVKLKNNLKGLLIEVLGF